MRITPLRLLKAFRQLFIDETYAAYYSPSIWEGEHREGYDLDLRTEDARYGALMSLMWRHERGGPILDAGCGDGLLEARYRSQSNATLVGVDYSETAVSRATERRIPNCEFVCCDYRSFEWKDSFSVIVFNESLYYVPDYLSTMTSMTKLLVEDGVIIVSMFHTPVTSRMWRKIRRQYETIQGVVVQDATTRIRWRLCVLRPPSG